jgi:hypothetical protein
LTDICDDCPSGEILELDADIGRPPGFFDPPVVTQSRSAAKLALLD